MMLGTFVRYAITFVVCAAFAVVSVVIGLAMLLPRGEGAFGIAKAVPFILVAGSAGIFCITWFLANVGVFLWSRRTYPSASDGGVPIVVLSGFLFAVCLAVVGIRLGPALHPGKTGGQSSSLEPPRKMELGDVKPVIDSFCAQERSGKKLTPADGIFATMEQLVYNSPPDILDYVATNLDARSGLWWVVARSPGCSPQLLESLAHSTNAQVRAGVAANRNAPKTLLEELAHDPEGIVREGAGRNPNRQIQH